MMGSQERFLQIQVLESGFSAGCHPVPCHSPHLQFDRTGARILLDRETVTVGAWSLFCPGTRDESGGHPPTNVPLLAGCHVCHGLGSLSNWCFILNSRVWSPG